MIVILQPKICQIGTVVATARDILPTAGLNHLKKHFIAYRRQLLLFQYQNVFLFHFFKSTYTTIALKDTSHHITVGHAFIRSIQS